MRGGTPNFKQLCPQAKKMVDAVKEAMKNPEVPARDKKQLQSLLEVSQRLMKNMGC